MEFKFFLIIGLVLAGIAGSYFIATEQRTDTLNTKLIVARQNATSYQMQIDQVNRQMQNKNTVSELLKITAELKAEKERIEGEVLASKAEHIALVESLRAAIAKIRRETVGMTFDELVLNGGAPLKEALIQEVSDDEIVIRHSLGIRRATSKEWPSALKERLLPGSLADTEFIATAPPKPKPDPVSTSADEAMKKHEKKVNAAAQSTAKMRQDLKALEQQLQQAESELNSNLSASRKYYTEVRRNTLRTQVQAQQTRLSAAETALRQLQFEQPRQ